MVPNSEKHTIILQEAHTDCLGSMIVYAPMDMPLLNLCVRGTDTRILPILPAGLVISSDGHRRLPGPLSAGESSGSSSSCGSNGVSSMPFSDGCLLTMTFQVMICKDDPNSVNNLNVDTVVTINSLITSTIRNIKMALNCADGD